MFVLRGWEHGPAAWLVTWFMVVTWPISEILSNNNVFQESVCFQGWQPGLINQRLKWSRDLRSSRDRWIEDSTDEDSLILTTSKYLSQSVFALKENFLDKIINISQPLLINGKFHGTENWWAALKESRTLWKWLLSGNTKLDVPLIREYSIHFWRESENEHKMF